MASAYDAEINSIYYNIVAKAKLATVTYGNTKYTGSVTIPATVTYNDVVCNVTAIGGSAFSGCSGLRSVTIPESVTTIGNAAFHDCSILKYVTIPTSVTSIEAWAFRGCSGLTSVTIPNSVTSVGTGTFYGCSDLRSVTIPNSVTSIGEYAFYNCSSLTSVTIGNSVTYIGGGAFSKCNNLNDIFCFAENVPETSSDAFKNDYSYSYSLYVPAASIDFYRTTAPWSGFKIKSLVNHIDGIYYALNTVTKQAIVSSGDIKYTGSVVIPETVVNDGVTYSVTSIGSEAFRYCPDLTSVTIGTSVTSIGEKAFYNCSGLTSVTIGTSVTSISSNAFYGCSGLTSVNIPNSVTYIGGGAFSGCSGLTSVTIPNSVTTIGEGAFSSCKELTDVYCYAENVLSASINAFKNSYIEYATLYVPETSVSAYQSTEPWSGFGTIKTLSGDIPEIPKCATPTIAFVDGEVTFDCETEGVEFVSHVEMPLSFDSNSDKFSLSTTCIVNVYATKDGYENSDIATKVINVSGSDAKKGDVNEDGSVNGTDIQEVINIIVNTE